MRPFILCQSNKPSFDANHRWGTVGPDVLEILPAELVGFKKESTRAFISPAVVVADTCWHTLAAMS